MISTFLRRPSSSVHSSAPDEENIFNLLEKNKTLISRFEDKEIRYGLWTKEGFSTKLISRHKKGLKKSSLFFYFWGFSEHSSFHEKLNILGPQWKIVGAFMMKYDISKMKILSFP